MPSLASQGGTPIFLSLPTVLFISHPHSLFPQSPRDRKVDSSDILIGASGCPFLAQLFPPFSSIPTALPFNSSPLPIVNILFLSQLMTGTILIMQPLTKVTMFADCSKGHGGELSTVLKRLCHTCQLSSSALINCTDRNHKKILKIPRFIRVTLSCAANIPGWMCGHLSSIKWLLELSTIARGTVESALVASP